ncbi:MAG TPA: two-component regulator propeller domain-containing protein, partial [Acidimicrobiales bacterium]|nr:two-component regulator propeller domain-containing protein [Acidimicrobiales bacterium]
MKTTKHKPLALLTMLLLTAIGHVFALDPNRDLTQYSTQNWRREQGLGNNGVRALAEAHDGWVLVATASGLLKFDGTQFRPLPVDAADRNANYAVRSLLVARDGAIWIGTEDHGLVVQTRSQTRIYTIANGLPSNYIQSLYQDENGAIWVGTAGGVCSIAESKVRCLPVEVKPTPRMWRNVVVDNSGGVLIAAQSKLFCWDHGSLTTIRLSGINVGEVRTLFRDRKEEIWAGTTTGLFRLWIHSSVAVFVRQRDVPGPVLALAEDQSGNLWISSFSHGLYRLNRMGIQHTTRSGNYIRALLVDHDDDLWIGSRAIGLTRWTDGSFIEYGLSEGLANSLAMAVREDSHGILWMGSDGGLQRFYKGRITANGLPTALMHKNIRAI